MPRFSKHVTGFLKFTWRQEILFNLFYVRVRNYFLRVDGSDTALGNIQCWPVWLRQLEKKANRNNVNKAAAGRRLGFAFGQETFGCCRYQVSGLCQLIDCCIIIAIRCYMLHAGVHLEPRLMSEVLLCVSSSRRILVQPKSFLFFHTFMPDLEVTR